MGWDGTKRLNELNASHIDTIRCVFIILNYVDDVEESIK